MALSVALTLMQILNSEVAPIVAVREWHEFLNGARGAQKGFVYTILITNNQFSPLNVKIEGNTAVIDQEILDQKNISLKFQMAKFQNFAAKPYADRNGQIQFSATADKIILVDNNTAGGIKQ